MGLFLFALELSILGGASAILALLFWPIKRRLRKSSRMGPRTARRITFAFILIPILGATGFTLHGLYPPDSFYRDEYRWVMDHELHPDARILRKSASYPDFRGEYASAALIELPPAEYDRLHALVQDTAKFRATEAKDYEEHRHARGSIALDELTDVYQSKAHGAGTICFVPGRPEVILMVCND